MKKIIFFTTVSLLCAVLSSSCQKDSVSNHEVIPEDESIGRLIGFYASCDGSDFSAGVSTKTTAEVTALDSFYVSATTGQYGSEESSWSQAVFKKKSGSSLYLSDKYWPSTDPGYNFYASNVKMTGDVACTVTADSGTDVVCAFSDKAVINESTSLTFSHIFARIGNVTINTQEGYEIDVTSISISCPVSGTYDIYRGNNKNDKTGWTPGEKTTVSLVNGDNTQYVVPGKYDLSVSYTLSKGTWSQSFQKTASVTLEKGKISKITGTATGGSASEVELTVILTDWGTADVNVTWN